MTQEKEIRIESLTKYSQFDECLAIQDAVWGYEPTDRMAQKVFLLASQIGGQVLGAYDGDTMVGYAMSLPGVRHGHAYLHSHHLAVLADWRNYGAGRRLKLAQREDGIARGFELMEWTFDPLEIKNSHLNFAKLGAISRRYKPNFYGASSSPLHGGLPTDRIVAEWWFKSDRVERILRGEQPIVDVQERVQVPAEISAWKSSDENRPKAAAVQAHNGKALQDAFAQGLSIIGYERDAEGNGNFLLGVWNELYQY